MPGPDGPAALLASLDATSLSRLSTAELMERSAEASRQMSALAGRLVLLTAELDRRQGWRAEGATSLESWIVERCGVSVPTARAWAHVGGRLVDLPALASALSAGEVSFDKVRAVADRATPETDAEVSAQARSCTVAELVKLGRSSRGAPEAAAERDYETRSLRFNDTFRTMTAQLPPETYAEVRAGLEGAAKQLPSDGETAWDQRLCDAFVQLLRSSRRGGDRGGVPRPSPHTVVAHVPLAALADDAGATTALAGDLERHGLVSIETVRRIACDATVVLAVDDDVGHTMYEGRARRDPTDAQRREIFRRDRHCRFPGCANLTFTNVHHVVPWASGRGRTDIDNLVLLCEHHHHRVHSRQWTVSGDANAELTFIGPTGRVMTSRPSPLWTAVTAPAVRPGRAPAS